MMHVQGRSVGPALAIASAPDCPLGSTNFDPTASSCGAHIDGSVADLLEGHGRT
jgi:hypothetical protein